MSERDGERDSGRRSFALSLLSFLLTLASTTWVGAMLAGADPFVLKQLPRGFAYSLPLMAILVSHELGHYVAARVHRVPASPPFFVPMPLPPLGTMGAVILMPGRIALRNALFDIGAAGPLAGFVVALPVLAYGIAESPVGPAPSGEHWLEGHSLLYAGLLWLLKGPFPDGHDILLSPTAFAGWAGMLVTMINLIPAVQLDGGHVAYALLGERQQRYSRVLRHMLLPLAAVVSLAYGLPAYFHGLRGDALEEAFAPGIQWALWWVVLHLLARGGGGREHPETDDSQLSPARRILAVGTLGLFVLLFMPAWLRVVPGH